MLFTHNEKWFRILAMKRERERRMELTQTTHSHSQIHNVDVCVCLCSLCRRSLHQLQSLSIASQIFFCDMKSKLVHAEMQTFERKREWNVQLHLTVFWRLIVAILKYDSISFTEVSFRFRFILSLSAAIFVGVMEMLRKAIWVSHWRRLLITPHLSLAMWITSQRKWEMKVIVTSKHRKNDENSSSSCSSTKTDCTNIKPTKWLLKIISFTKWNY